MSRTTEYSQNKLLSAPIMFNKK